MPDPGDIHGGLLALTELAAAFRDSLHYDQLESERRKVGTSHIPVPTSDFTLKCLYRYSLRYPKFLYRR